MPDKIKKIRGDDPRLSSNSQKKRKGYRSIHLPNGVWQWKTDGVEVIIYSPTRERVSILYWDMLSTTEEAFRKKWNESKVGNVWYAGECITPGEIRDFIVTVLMK